MARRYLADAPARPGISKDMCYSKISAYAQRRHNAAPQANFYMQNASSGALARPAARNRPTTGKRCKGFCVVFFAMTTGLVVTARQEPVPLWATSSAKIHYWIEHNTLKKTDGMAGPLTAAKVIGNTGVGTTPPQTTPAAPPRPISEPPRAACASPARRAATWT